ncbi:zinc finger protein Helios-like isoform X2 [Scleropages formosus]|uniref:IKAROS family zinc finger 2 n=1 Tax=Scleropages formosus TaxID=113540 RepID=A0A8C9VGM0_SCLFO|nr:zinc finger protein Helios-like isoform X2 [Scleropages formosus]
MEEEDRDCAPSRRPSALTRKDRHAEDGGRWRRLGGSPFPLLPVREDRAHFTRWTRTLRSLRDSNPEARAETQCPSRVFHPFLEHFFSAARWFQESATRPSPLTMETEATHGYLASNGDCSPRKENPRTGADMSPDTPNGQHPHVPSSPTSRSIKQEEGAEDQTEKKTPELEETGQSGEEGSGLEEPMIDSPNNLPDGGPVADGPSDTGIRLSNGERPFQCSQCGVSFTQKGNLLRHIKLHTGEKPFKCPFCSYACRRRDALTGHLRTHSVGKPHKCNYCGRSYKQRASLEEHKERCHNYLQSIGMDPASNMGAHQEALSATPADIKNESKPGLDSHVVAPFDRPPVIERLQGNVAKRKSTMPQKFVGEKVPRYIYPDMGYNMGLKYEKEAELMQAHMMDQAISNAISYLGADSLRPLVHHPQLPMAEGVPMVTPLFAQVYPVGHRVDRPSSREAPPPLPTAPADFSVTANGPLCLARRRAPQGTLEESPSNSLLDSADSERSSPQERLGRDAQNHGPSIKSSLSCLKEEGREAEHGGPEKAEVPRAYERSATRDAFRVFSCDGQEVRAFRCEHCRVLFLDHVMYTIHMGCHGYRDPLECNICGVRCQDRYEFSSHIIRGEHTFH